MANGGSAVVRAVPGLEWRVDDVNRLYEELEPLIKKYAARVTTIETAALVMSVVTSGAFWALVSDAVPKSMGLLGAAISTVATFLTIYLYSSGLATKRKSSLFIYKELNKFMAKARTDPDLSDSDYTTTWKLIDTMIKELKYGAAEG